MGRETFDQLTLVAMLDASFYADPSKLLNAGHNQATVMVSVDAAGC